MERTEDEIEENYRARLNKLHNHFLLTRKPI
jgi:hypothetical protein